MSITAEFPYKCPVCEQGHAREGLVVGMAMIACPKVTPTGTPLMFPKFGVIVIGAGLGVNEKPAKEPTLDELRALVAEKERATVVTADAEAEREALKAKLAALEAPKA